MSDEKKDEIMKDDSKKTEEEQTVTDENITNTEDSSQKSDTETAGNDGVSAEDEQDGQAEHEDEIINLSDEEISEKPKKKRSLLKKVMLYMFLLFILISICVAGGVGAYVYKLSKELPSTKDLADFVYKQPTIIYANDGSVLAEIGDERRYPVPLEKMPAFMYKAVVAVEDSRFYEHGGVDLLGIFRAFVANVRAGRVVEGGSTLTQQLVKIIYLTPERKLKRKVKEAILAYKIDKTLSKEKILEIYLNQVYFGRGAYGVEAAAINYFGKSISDLDLSECALIAGLPKSPSGYAPHIHPEKALKRRSHVLYRMYEMGFITEQEMNEAKVKELNIVETIPAKNNLAGYFIDHVLKYLSTELDRKDPANEGLRVYTTLNIDYQKKAETAVKNNLISVSKELGYFGPISKYEPDSEAGTAANSEKFKQLLELKYDFEKELNYQKAIVTKVDENIANISLTNGSGTILLKQNRWAVIPGSRKNRLTDLRDILKKNDLIYVSINNESERTYNLEQVPPIEGSMLVMNPHTAEIYAMVGGFDYALSKFNRSTQAKRQVGSLFKPIVYSTALENGFTAMTEIFDAPIVKQMEEKDEYWTPGNESNTFYGMTTLKTALTNSRNIVTIKLAEKVGIGKILNYAKKFGITEELQRDLSVSIGSGSVSLQEMVSAFSVFPNMGKRYMPVFVKKVEDINGETILTPQEQEAIEVIAPSTAQIMTDILVNVVQNGTGVRAKNIPRMIAGKTGTTNDSKDTWFIGFMPDLVCGTWVGYDDNRQIGDRRFGSNTALPSWIEFITGVLEDYPFKAFPTAENVNYMKVDSETKKITDSFTESYTFEPFDEGTDFSIDKSEKEPVQND